MNKKIPIIAMILAIPMLMVGCSDKETYNSSETLYDNESETLSDFEKMDALEKEYVGMLNEDFSNADEIAQKYVKEVYNEDTEVFKEMFINGSNYVTSYLRLKNNPETVFTVEFTKDDGNVHSDHREVIVSEILSRKFNDEFKELLPKDAKIYITSSIRNDIDVYSIENKTIDEIIEDDCINMSWAAISIPTTNTDYEVYRKLIIKFAQKLDELDCKYMDVVFADDTRHIDVIKKFHKREVNEKEMPSHLYSAIQNLENMPVHPDSDMKEYYDVLKETYQGTIHCEFESIGYRLDDLTNESEFTSVESLIRKNPRKNTTN